MALCNSDCPNIEHHGSCLRVLAHTLVLVDVVLVAVVAIVAVVALLVRGTHQQPDRGAFERHMQSSCMWLLEALGPAMASDRDPILGGRPSLIPSLGPSPRRTQHTSSRMAGNGRVNSFILHTACICACICGFILEARLCGAGVHRVAPLLLGSTTGRSRSRCRPLRLLTHCLLFGCARGHGSARPL